MSRPQLLKFYIEKFLTLTEVAIHYTKYFNINSAFMSKLEGSFS